MERGLLVFGGCKWIKLNFNQYQLVGFTDMTNMQTVLQAFSEVFGREVVGIDTFVYDGHAGGLLTILPIWTVNIGEGVCLEKNSLKE